MDVTTAVTSSPADKNTTLADLREEIDRIDAAMHDLLMERGRIIDRLVAVKKTVETGSAFRPAREAAVIARLVERHSGRLPAEVVVSIWRQIISTFTYIQSPHAVHVLLNSELGAARELARLHFGFGVPLVKHSNVASVIDAVARDGIDLGCIMLGPASEPWWRRLGHDGEPVVMGVAPALTRATAPRGAQAAIIGHPSIDTSGLGLRVVALVLSDAAPSPVDAVIAAAEDKAGRRHVLAWGAREASEAEIASDVAGASAVEEARTVGYTAKPLAV